MPTIRHLKLTTGEEIIGKEAKETTNAYYLESVRVLVVQQVTAGQAGVAMIPWMMGNADGIIRIPTNFVIGEPEELPKNLEDGYLQQTSGITFASGQDGVFKV